jgi:ribosome assembly protein RRB1
MNHSNVVATWSEDGEVGIYDITVALEELDNPTQKKTAQKKAFASTKISSFKHKSEGYALEWSPSTFGRLASGNNDAQLNLYTSADETGSSFIKETTVGLQGH